MSSSSNFDSDSDEDLILGIAIMGAIQYQTSIIHRQPCRTSALQGHQYINEILRGNPTRCYENFRMTPTYFLTLSDIMKSKGLMQDSKGLSVEEQLGIFLLVLSHNSSLRLVAERFQHSLETISRYFKKTLKAMCWLGTELIVPQSFHVTPPEIMYNRKYYLYFKDCVGAIDGTHVTAHVPVSEQIPYRGKHTTPTQNIICVCGFDMRFTYVLSGWEGTANDARILLECISNQELNFPMPPMGKYYVVDSGFANMPGFLSPYRGTRYHLRDYHGCSQPNRREELFNFRHSSLRNVIKRCFGVLKARFPILNQMPPYDLRTQRYIVTACATLHNFIRSQNGGDSLFKAYGSDNPSVDSGECSSSGSAMPNPIEVNVTQAQMQQMSLFRDSIAEHIWTAEQM